MKEFTEVRRKESFNSLSKGGKGPDAENGVIPEGWGFESFIGLQRARCRKEVVGSYMFWSTVVFELAMLL